VIQVGTASRAIHDTLGIELEDGTRGIDGDTSWLLVDGSLDLGNALLWHGGVLLDSDLLFGGLGLALSISTSVAIISLELNWGLLGVLESPYFETTVTALVATLGAVNKLLLGKLKKLTSLDSMGALHGSDG